MAATDVHKRVSWICPGAIENNLAEARPCMLLLGASTELFHESMSGNKPLEQPPLDGVLVVMQQTVQLILQELSVSIHQSELQERITTLQNKMNNAISQIEECDETLQDIDKLETKNEVDEVEINRQCGNQPKKIMLIEVDTKSEEDHDDASYEFHDFLSEVVRMHKIVKILDIGVVGDSAHDWQTVLAIWKKVIDDCKNTWILIIGQIG